MPSVDQKRRELLRFLAEHGGLLAAQGSVQETYRCYQGRRLGPFFRLSFREAGKQRAVYIGRDRALAAEIQRHLQELQAPLLWARQLERSLAQHRRALRTAKLEFRRRLEAQGLRLQGNEIRGWRRQQQVVSAALHRPARRGAALRPGRDAPAPPPAGWLRGLPPQTPRRRSPLRQPLEPLDCQPKEPALVQPEPLPQSEATLRRGLRAHGVY